jgi:hypothetical protein
MSTRAPAFTVLMTASVAPKKGVREMLKRSDPEQRLKDYQTGLQFWLSLDEPRIKGVVFAENTGFPLSGLRGFAEERNSRGLPLEFLSFDYPPVSPNLSYGCSEFQLVREAVARSAVAAQTEYFVKATGRYTFPDIRRLLARLPAEFKIAGDSKGFRPFGRKTSPLMTVALILFRTGFFQSDVAPLVDTMIPAPPWTRSQFIETVLFDAFYPRRLEPGVILRWPCNCEPRGIGSNGDNYATARKRLQSALRAIARVARPSLWM